MRAQKRPDARVLGKPHIFRRIQVSPLQGLCALRVRIGRRADHAVAVLEQRRVDQLVKAMMRRRNRKIDVAVGDHLFHLFRAGVVQRERDLGISLAERRDGVAQEVVGDRRHHRDPHMPLTPLRQRFQVAQGAVELAEDALGFRLETRGLRRHRHAPCAAVKQLDAYRVLELLDRRRQRGLGQEQLRGRHGERTRVGHGDETAKVPQGDAAFCRHAPHRSIYW